MIAPPLLEVSGLRIALPARAGTTGAVEVVRGIDLRLRRGETLGVVGESGCGKSITMLAIMGLLPPGAQATGSVRLEGREILGATQRELARLRGRTMAMIFQDPLTALNPVLTIGAHFLEAIRLHNPGIRRAEARARAESLLKLVSISEPAQRFVQYPHEFSGGMRQRVGIALAVANNPALLIADEPTTALDVTIQAQVLELLVSMRERLGLALAVITHDLGIVAGAADRVAVMYAGRIVEAGTVDEVFARPRHPYTIGLLAAVPRVDIVAPLVAIDGAPPPLMQLPPGCAFHPRCSRATALCRVEVPALHRFGGALAACHHAEL